MIGLFTWLSVQDTDPPHAVSHPDKLVELANAFLDGPWEIDKPVLIGYPLGGRIQLLSGSHRWHAAQLAGTKLPVLIRRYDDVADAWGTSQWAAIMQAPNLTDLERKEGKER